MADHPPGRLHWATAFAAAIAVLVLAVPLVTAAAPWRYAKAKSPWGMRSSRDGRAVFTATGVLPGQQSSGRLSIANTGAKPIRKVTLTQDKVTNTGFGPAMTLQVFDRTAKRCLYPKPVIKKPKKPKKGRKPAPVKIPTKCLAWAPWTAGKALRKLPVEAKKGSAWKPREKHTIDVRWKLDAASPNSDMGRTATFRLTWRGQA